ncbi:phage late control D family protein [Dyella sp. M7H15-1]|uniref:phage late control D family protein n=1 Tax=Dyella sp. M7H15-1 TaxID=2501295 RepID=UPI00100521EB|nr:phage late control D family protein [Dyella sp. M7H15-1]QAU25014.1 phage late control D family protein [Dyella sp. M7H15-1]
MCSARVETAAFQILLNGRPLANNLSSAITAVEVSNQLNVPGMFSFTFNLMSPQGNWQGVDLETFKPGAKVEVQLGIGQPKSLIKGQIYAIDPSFGPYSSATVSGFDAMARLRFGNHTRDYENMDENQIAITAAKSSQVKVVTPGAAVALNAWVCQSEQSNYDFILGRCKLIHYELVVSGTDVQFRPSAEGLSPVKTLSFPLNLHSVSLQLRVRTEGSSVKAVSFDPLTNQQIVAQSNPNTTRVKMGGSETGYDFSSDFPSASMALADYSITRVEALQAYANAEYLKNVGGFIEGSAELAGDPSLVAGVNVRLKGLSQSFDGIYYVQGSTHRYDLDSGYRTSLTLKRSGA